mgnify:CR=1 FL=1
MTDARAFVFLSDSSASASRVSHARSERVARSEARFALAAREVARADPDRPGGRREGFGEFCTDELRALLCVRAPDLIVRTASPYSEEPSRISGARYHRVAM